MRIVGDDTQIYNFGDTLRQIRSIAYRLEREGVAFGDRVALIGENHPCWAIAYLGILYRGAVCVPMDPHGETETVKNFLENSEAKLAFVGQEVEDKGSQDCRSSRSRSPRSLCGHKKAPLLPKEGWPRLWEAGVVLLIVRIHSTTSTTGPQLPIPTSFAGEIPKASGDDIALLIIRAARRELRRAFR
jgi:non-ribosomal peptide synthetase component F